MPLDAINPHVLRRLQQDGWMSSQDLAEKVFPSPSVCLHRLRLLESEGIIHNYSMELDARRLGMELEAIVYMSLRQNAGGWYEIFAVRARDWPEVVTAYVMTGTINYVLRVRVYNLKHYSDFIVNKLSRAVGVIDIRPETVLQEIKASADLPNLMNLKS